ncbi:putative TonB-dependent receptor [Pseudodesulfovibrio profundus]|uniref:Putative TonB-dependent receptor n=1 Tax=Pseudodesulfovibrio profundus TaxID=57320 RepID=A0A2C8F9G6_9BACT|nr:TonB-dependent receptor [Pseudodesulfovibrio profundus]SOB58521.1 putative TonB-dependent receptor [Pseudodesulfovibrio profundus]
MSVVALLLAFCLFIPTAWAAESRVDPSSGVLPEVVVTATSVPTPSKEVPVHVQIVTSEEIKNTDAKDVSDVLAKFVPGHFHKYGADYSSVGLRGFRSNSMAGTDLKSKTLILIDGMRAGTGRVSVLPVDNVDRIEIVRGPGSVIYGGSAMGGVINIITRRGKGDVSGNIGAEAGSFGQYRVKANASGATENDTGYSVAGHGERQGSYVTGGGEEIENSQMTDRGLSASLTYRKDAANDLHMAGIYNHSDKGSPGSGRYPSATDNSKSTYKRMAFDWTTDRGDAPLGWYAKGYAVKHAYVWNDHATEIDTTTGGLRTGADLETGSFGNLLLGVEYDRIKEEQRKSVWGPNTEYNNYALLAEQRITAGDFLFYLGGRFDDYNMKMKETPSITVAEGSRKFTNLSWRGGAVYDAAEWLSFRTAVGTGFRAPSAEELAGSYTTSWGATYSGNPNLKAETATTAEIGTDFYLGDMTAGATLFHTQSKNSIVTTGSFPNYTYENIKGINLTAFEGYLRSSHDVTYNKTKIVFQPYLNGIYYLDRKNMDDALTNARGTNTPLYISEMSLTAGLTTHIGKQLTHDLNMVYVGDQKIQSFKTTPSTYKTMSGYTVFGTRLTFKPGANISTYIDVQNLLNKKYDCVDDYTMPGRSMKLGVNYDF